jgi:hypothetical protein
MCEQKVRAMVEAGNDGKKGATPVPPRWRTMKYPGKKPFQ